MVRNPSVTVEGTTPTRVADAMVDVDDRPRQLLIKTDRKDDDRVLVSVRDAGVGIDAQTMDKLFERVLHDED